MRPDLFAGPAMRDDSHRILARLANGGSVPAPARQWIRWDPPQRARLAAVATLLATGVAAWVWLQNDAPAPERPPVSPMRAEPAPMPAPGMAARDDATSLAATIVTVVAPQREAAIAPPMTTSDPAPASGPAQASAKPPDSKTMHPRSARPAAAARRQQSAAPASESDEDVTLLAAMLKHAKPQKPPLMPAKD